MDVLLTLRQSVEWVFVTRFFHYFSDALDLLPPAGASSRADGAPYSPFLLEELLLEEVREERASHPFIRLLKTLAGWRAIKYRAAGRLTPARLCSKDNWVEAGLRREYAKRNADVPAEDGVLPEHLLDWPLALKVPPPPRAPA